MNRRVLSSISSCVIVILSDWGYAAEHRQTHRVRLPLSAPLVHGLLSGRDLQIPEEDLEAGVKKATWQYFVERCGYDKASGDYLCYKLYHPLTEEQWKTIEGKFRPGRTSSCFSFRPSTTQTVSGLQIRTPMGEWKHVKSIPDGITVNAGDTLAMITDGYIKSTIHAVQRPPPDQDKYDRLALLYFLRLADDVPVIGAPSLLLQRIG